MKFMCFYVALIVVISWHASAFAEGTNFHDNWTRTDKKWIAKKELSTQARTNQKAKVQYINFGDPPQNNNHCDFGDLALTFDISNLGDYAHNNFVSFYADNIFVDAISEEGNEALDILLDHWRYHALEWLNGNDWSGRKVKICVGAMAQASLLWNWVGLEDIVLWYDIPEVNPPDPNDAPSNNDSSDTNFSTISPTPPSSTKKPDLYVKRLEFNNGKTSYYSGDTIHVKGYAKNVGKSVSTELDNISFKLYRFKGDNENGDRREIDNEKIKGKYLGSNKTKDEEFSFKAPDDENKYQLYAIIDAKNVVSEANENNNRSGNIVFRVHNLPNIQATDLKLTDGRLRFQVGEIPNARVTFENFGGEPFDDVQVKWTLDGNYYADDNIRHWNIEKDEEAHEDVNLISLSVGAHTIRACADIDDKHSSDNCKEVTFEVYSDDLTVSTVQLTNTLFPVPTNSMYGASMTVQNNGMSNLAGGIQSTFEIKGPSTNDQWTRIGEESIEASGLISGATITQETMTLIPTPNTPGNYELRGCLDTQHIINETDESNNCVIAPFTVVPGGPDLVISQVSLTGGKNSLKQGEHFGLRLVTLNQGNTNVLSDFRNSYSLLKPGVADYQVVADDGTHMDKACVGCSYEEYTINDPFVADVLGTWQAKACADYQFNVTELDEYNNCRVFSFSVAPVINQTITVTDPGSGETWSTKNDHTINWTTTDIPSSAHMNISYSVDNGAKWYTLDSATINDGSKKWETKKDNHLCHDTNQARIKIVYVENPGIYVISDRFTIDHKKGYPDCD